MNRQGQRIGIAWLLLSVFVSMLLLSGLHRHEAVASAAIDCTECAHHVHHSGHFTTSVDHMDDCLLCQFQQLVYEDTPQVSLAFILPEIEVNVQPFTVDEQNVFETCSLSRAPPVLL